MFHLRFGLSDHLKALLDFVFGSRRRVKKVRIFRAWFSHNGTSGTVTKQVTALGLSKATQEFLTLHYFAIDSAEWWERILKELLPNARFPGAVVRRSLTTVTLPLHIGDTHTLYGLTLSDNLRPAPKSIE